jgi:hypothetical protein
MIAATLVRATRRSSHQALYDKGAGVLSAEVDGSVGWKNGLDYNGKVLLDLDANLRLCNVDLAIPKADWVKKTIPRCEQKQGSWDIRFSDVTMENRSYTGDLDVTLFGSSVYVTFGLPESIEMYSITTGLSGLMQGTDLVGFRFQLTA